MRAPLRPQAHCVGGGWMSPTDHWPVRVLCARPVRQMRTAVEDVLALLASPRTQQLFLLSSSPTYAIVAVAVAMAPADDADGAADAVNGLCTRPMCPRGGHAARPSGMRETVAADLCAHRRYAARLEESLRQKLHHADKMEASILAIDMEYGQLGALAENTASQITACRNRIRELQQNLERALSERYAGRPVHLIGEINTA